MGMFDFINDIGNYEERKVARYEKGNLFVDTARVSDSSKPFETAICHPAYNDNELIIVELYDTIEEAQAGQQKWIDVMLHHPPNCLVDVSTSCVANMLRALGDLPPYERARD